MGPYGSENFKHHSYESQPKVWDLGHPICVHLGFLNFEFPIFNDFFLENLKFTIVPYGESKNLNYMEKERS